MQNKNFDLNDQYKLYLQRVNLSESTMNPTQKTETKRAFFGACGQLLIMIRDEVGSLSEEDAMGVFKNLLDQVGDFWLKQKKETN